MSPLTDGATLVLAMLFFNNVASLLSIICVFKNPGPPRFKKRMHTNSCCFFNSICGIDKGVNFMLPGDQIGAVTGLVPALLSQCTEFAFLFRHLEGHLHARPARLRAALPLAGCDAKTRYVG